MAFPVATRPRFRLRAPCAALLMALIPIPGCSPQSESAKPESGPSGQARVRAAVVECLAASTRWRTLQARYRIEGSEFREIAVAFERGGRVAWWGYDDERAYRFGAVGAGADLYFVYVHEDVSRVVGKVNMAPMAAAAEAFRAGRPIQPPETGFDPVAVHWRCEVLLTGKPLSADLETVFHLHCGASEPGPFGWLSALGPSSRNIIEILGDGLRVSDGVGTFLIDRRTGLLVECCRAASPGNPVSVRLLDMQVDAILDEALFDVSGEPYPARELRRWCAQFALYSFENALEACPVPAERAKKCLEFFPLLLEMMWTPAERSRIADVGRRHIDEVAAELRKAHPGVLEKEIRQAAETTALQAIVDEVIDERSEFYYPLCRISGLAGMPELEKLGRELDALLFRLLIQPAEKAAKEKR